MFDSFDREITYLRISVTDRCNLRCTYCMPPGGVRLKKSSEILSYEEIVQIVRVAARLGISKIRLTGGEPLIRKNLISLIRSLKNIEGIEEVTLTTNGVLLARMAPELKRAGLDRINVSLDTLVPKKYEEMTRGGSIRRVLEGIDAASQAGFKNTKLNMVLIPGFNEKEVEHLKAFCKERGLHLQRINHYALPDRNSINRAYEAEKPLSCHRCNRIRLTADAKLKPCLFSDIEVPVDFADIDSCIKLAVLNKPESGRGCSTRGNWEIGG
ncbi:MAG: radical SAM protein [Candidatus Aminicenantes bacterium]|jgi:cyclic pyranopterin phosphate synthase